MAITHQYVSSQPDGADTSLVRPSDWNADHTGECAGAVPVGAIIMWSGAIAAIPVPEWQLCDGTANAPGPDLRDKFVVGARQDDAGVAKTNIEGSLKQTGGATGHSHSAHANLSHAGGAVGDHTGFTHGLTIGDHPDLTHAALSHAAQTFAHADHTIASASHTHASVALAHVDISLASFSGTHASLANASGPSGSFSLPSMTHTHASGTHSHASIAGVASFASGTNRSGRVSQPSETGTQASLTGSDASQTGTFASNAAISVPSGTHSHAASTVTQPAHTLASFSGTHASLTLGHADHSFPSLSHQDIGTHVGTTYGTHAFTAPAAHGTAGTVTHSFTQPNEHAVSAHDTVLTLPNYYALAFIQRML